MSGKQNTNLFGFLNVYKPKGMTSFDVVAILRRVTKIRQIGHTGTLDPFAVGVLPICIGKSTRLIEYLNDDKEYLATVQFGSDTDTYDLEGQVIRTYDKKITKEEVENILKSFEGEIEQIPPIYSAIKVNGKKLYEYARNGQEVEIKPRKVFISKIELKDFDTNLQQAKILVDCSKGTYIRSIAFDLGRKMNCGGHLVALERTKAGMFLKKNSTKLEDIKTLENVENLLINPVEVLDYPKINLTDIEKEKVSHGMSIANNSGQNSGVVILVYGGKIYAIGIAQESKISIKKVFEVL